MECHGTGRSRAISPSPAPAPRDPGEEEVLVTVHELRQVANDVYLGSQGVDLGVTRERSVLIGSSRTPEEIAWSLGQSALAGDAPRRVAYCTARRS